MDTIIDILKENNITYKVAGQHKHATQKYTQIDCPFCSPNTSKFRMGINNSHSICWRCGYHRLGDTLVVLLDIHISSAMKMLNTIQNLSEIPHLQTHTTNKSVKIPNGLREFGIPHTEYMLNRGFDPNNLTKMIDFWGLEAFHHQGMSWRIWIPIQQNGKTVSWTTRSIGKTKTKYLSAKPNEEITSHKKLLFGADHCYHVAIVCEGPFDVFKIGPGAVALFGLNCSREQLWELSQFPVRVVCFDSEPKAQYKAKQLVNYLRYLGGETYNIELESGNDPGDADPEEIKEIRKQFLE